MTQTITKAVMPVAGVGTRFYPVAKSVPKALLPILDKPLIHYAALEAAEAGIRELALVIAPGMESVPGYLMPNPELHATLRERGKHDLAERLEQMEGLFQVTQIVQRQPRGLGHAVLQAREWTDGQPFAVILPDDLVWGGPPAISQLLDAHARFGGQVLGAVRVSDEQVPFKGIIDGSQAAPRVTAVKRVVEKPPLEEAPGNLSILGRYVLGPEVFAALERGQAGAGGEIQVTDAIQATVGQVPLHAVEVEGRHIDTGNPRGMLEASLYQAQRDPRMGNLLEQLRGGGPGG